MDGEPNIEIKIYGIWYVCSEQPSILSQDNSKPCKDLNNALLMDMMIVVTISRSLPVFLSNLGCLTLGVSVKIALDLGLKF